MTETPGLPQSVVVREAHVADAAETAALGSAGFRAAHAEIVDAPVVAAIVSQMYSEERIRHSIAACHKASGVWFLVARGNSGLVGFLEYDEQQHAPELHRLYVDLARKRTGIGSALLASLHDRLPAERRYRVTVAAGNCAALRFYARHDFIEIGRAIQHYPGVQLPPDAQPNPVVYLKSPDLDARASDHVRNLSQEDLR